GAIGIVGTIVSSSYGERVVPIPAIEDIVPITAGNRIVSTPAPQRIIPIVANQRIVSRSAINRIVPCPPVDIRRDRYVRTHQQRVVPPQPVQRHLLYLGRVQIV